MEYFSALEHLGKGSSASQSAVSEEDWHHLWISQGLCHKEPLTTSLTGGALADRLAWVFHAGYQGMMRYAFPFLPENGWASYLVAEDKSGEYPGTVLMKSADQLVLSGNKNWVAGSKYVSQLIVRVSRADDEVLVVVNRNDKGTILSHRDKPGFLCELSQGFASFKDVVIPKERIFTLNDLPDNFAQSEPHHVLTALNAFMLSHINQLGGNDDLAKAINITLRLAGELVSNNVVGDEFFLGIADMDAATTESAHLFESFIQGKDSDLHNRWQRDRGLVKLFSRGLQKRAKWLRDG